MLRQIAGHKVTKSQSPQVKKITAIDLLFCLISAILLILSFPRPQIWIFAWFGFVPLFFAIQNKNKIQSFLLAYLTGIIFWWSVIYWLVHVTFIGTAVLISYLALYFAAFGICFNQSTKLRLRYRILFIPASWLVLEYMRSYLLTGFGWAILAHSQYLNLPIIQISSITGAWGVSFLIIFINTSIFYFLKKDTKQKTRLAIVLFASLFLSVIFFFGINSLYPKKNSDLVSTSLKISLIQPNIPQEMKWNEPYKYFILNKTLELTKDASQNKPDLIIWPEAALPVIMDQQPAFIEEVKIQAQEDKVNILLGAVREKDNLYFNSSVLIDASGKLAEIYDKIHLVPFGEYIPLKKVLPFLQAIVPIGDVEKGKDFKIFSIKKDNKEVKFATLICFEDVFSNISRSFVNKGAQFLINITNDAWYKKTSASWQHLQSSVFRAVENKVFLLRAANTGISAVISPQGEILSVIEDENRNQIFVSGEKTSEINILKNAKTFYTIYGDIFVYTLFLFFFFCLYKIFLFKIAE